MSHSPSQHARFRTEWNYKQQARDIYTACRWPTAQLKTELEAREIYDASNWPTTQWFQRAKCRRLLVEMLESCRAWEKEKWAKRSPPAAFEDASGRPIAPPRGGSEVGS